MKILFGIQGTGNGHIIHSREILKTLVNEAQVDVLVSGLHHEVDLGFEIKYRHQGLGFMFGKKGGIDYWKSISAISPYRLISDIKSLPVEKYDLILSDFEPLSAWAAKIKGKLCISISHQASLLSSNVPRPSHNNRFQQFIMQWYAPGDNLIGLHFKEYDDFIFTPIIRQEIRESDPRDNEHYTVYLPSYDERFMIDILKKIDVPWEIFSKHYKGEPFKEDNLTVFPVENQKFVQSLSTCTGLLCNAGFDTPSEALYLGKKLMVVPMKRQYEQECNAEALKGLGVPVVDRIRKNFSDYLKDWVESSYIYQADYKNNIPQIVERVIGFAK